MASRSAVRSGSLGARLGELVAGLVLLSCAGLAAVWFVHRPTLNRFDTLGYSMVSAAPQSHLAHDVAWLGSAWAVLIGTVVAFVAMVGRDRRRAIALVVAPIVAVVVTERIAKPLVGHKGPAGLVWSYPSGHVTAVAAVATAWCLCTPSRWRAPAFVVLAAAVLAVAVAVIRLRWHYPTDVAGGICVGVGTVLVADAIARLSRRRAPSPALPPRRFSPRLSEGETPVWTDS